jgi:hypothetical protein
LFVEAVGEDRLHGAIGVGAKVQCPFACRLEAFFAITVGETDDAEGGPEALFGMGS